MVNDEIKYRIRQSLGFPPTEEQERAIGVFADFLVDADSRAVMILRGSAGTGKTTLAAAIVRALTALGQKLVLLAPTGRAAKVFSLYAGSAAYTIHRRIYRQKSLEGGFSLNFNTARDTLFIVDEASMIANQGLGESVFGSGCLLDDLVEFVYGLDNNCRMLLIGDPAQLPPVGETESPALSALVLRGYGMTVSEANLSEVLRQSQESGILFNATRIRTLFHREEASPAGGGWVGAPRISLAGFSDVKVVPGDELIESLATSYSRTGIDDTIVITRSNKRANIYNQGIRSTVLDRDEELCRGDRLMIVKNNYSLPLAPSRKGESLPLAPSRRGESLPLTPSRRGGNEASPSGGGLEGWGGKKASPSGGGLEGAFIANGDIAVVQRIRNVHEQHGFRFAEVTLSFPDYDDYELTAMVLLDTLTSESPSLTREQQQQLYNRVMEDYADVPFKADRLKKLKEDRYYNALQVKFAYAVTCHKAQGGQWSHVYIDQGYMTDDMLGPDYLHWLYTAFTRATDRLFLVNWPATQVQSE